VVPIHDKVDEFAVTHESFSRYLEDVADNIEDIPRYKLAILSRPAVLRLRNAGQPTLDEIDTLLQPVLAKRRRNF